MNYSTNVKERIGIIGYGRIATTYIDAIESLKEAENISLTVIVEKDSSKTDRIENLSVFSDYKDPRILDLVDSVIVCTPPNTHFQIANYFLSNRIPVLCEKPLTISTGDAETLIEKSRTTKTLLSVASKFLYVDDVERAKAILASGVLGKIISYENVFCSKIDMSNRWNSVEEISGGGVIIDNAPHAFLLAKHLLGPLRLLHVSVSHSDGLAVEDTARLIFKTDADVIGTIHTSWSFNTWEDSYVSLYGSEGTLELCWARSRYRLRSNNKWVYFGNGYNKVSAFRQNIKKFLELKRRKENPQNPQDDYLFSVKIIEDAYRSLI